MRSFYPTMKPLCRCACASKQMCICEPVLRLLRATPASRKKLTLWMFVGPDPHTSIAQRRWWDLAVPKTNRPRRCLEAQTLLDLSWSAGAGLLKCEGANLPEAQGKGDRIAQLGFHHLVQMQDSDDNPPMQRHQHCHQRQENFRRTKAGWQGPARLAALQGSGSSRLAQRFRALRTRHESEAPEFGDCQTPARHCDRATGQEWPQVCRRLASRQNTAFPRQRHDAWCREQCRHGSC